MPRFQIPDRRAERLIWNLESETRNHFCLWVSAAEDLHFAATIDPIKPARGDRVQGRVGFPDDHNVDGIRMLVQNPFPRATALAGIAWIFVN
jgi:hypothetical protein